MKKQVLASYSGKPGIVRLPSIESSNHTIQLCGKITTRSYSLSNPINDNNNSKSILPSKSRPTSQASKQYSIDQQMMSTIRVDIEKMIESGQEFLQYNHSKLITQVQLHENLVKLQELYLPFFRDALAFYTSPNSFTDEDKTFITSSSVRSSSFSFLQQWKSVISILDMIDDQGISSLFDFMNDKFNSIFKGIEAVTTKPEKHTVIYETIGKSTSILNTSLTNLHKLITQLFENFTDPTSESISYYFSEIKQFLSLYNESFYNVFPKAGFLPYELANLKSDTLTASNDIMNSLRALFSFWPYLKEINMYKEEIQKLLDSAVCQMRLPPSLVRLIAPLPKKKTKQVQENEKKLRPEFTKLEAFISNVLKTIEKPPLDQKIDLWKRLKTVENMIADYVQNLNDIILKIRGQSHNLQTLMVEADSRKKEIEKLRAHNNDLYHQNQIFESQLEEITKIAEKRKEKIEILQNDAEKLEEKQTIEKVSTKLNEMMKNVDSNIKKIDIEKSKKSGQNESENEEEEGRFTSLEKLNIFVLEKKCKTCRQYEQQKRELMKLLQPLVGSTQNESLHSLIQSLIKRQEKLEIENAKITAEFEEKKAELEKVEEATKSFLEKSGNGTSQILNQKGNGQIYESNKLLRSFQNIEDQHQNEITTIQNELNDSHTRELNKISEMFDGIISDGEDINKNRKSGRKNNSNNNGNSILNSNIENDRKNGKFKNSNFANSTDNYNGFTKSGKRKSSFNNDSNSFDDDDDNEESGNRKHSNKKDINEGKTKLINNEEDEFKNIVMEKVKKAASKIESLQKENDINNELLEKVLNWMKTQVEGIDIDGMDLAQSLTILMDAIDNKENPLQSKVDRLERESQKVTAQCKKLVDKLCELKHVDRVSTSKMSVTELLKVAERESMKLNKKLENAQSKVDSHDYEIESTRNSLQTVAERLHHLLQLDDNIIEFDKMDMNCLISQILKYIDNLMTGGTKQLLIPVSDINDMAKNAKKNSKFPNSSDPKVYLPDIFEKFFKDDESINVIKLFENPLEDIFKHFDFKKSSFDPDHESFKFLREKIFQLHLILGKDNNVIYDSKIHNIMKRFISLSSALFSYIASSFLDGKEIDTNESESNV